MPKETFHNLPTEKRDLVVRCAYEEFARRDYRSASLSRVVERAGIAKGSVYQYFENKLDLYRYLIRIATERKLEYLADHPDVAEGGFFDRLRAIVFRSLQFNLENPLPSHLLYLAARETPTSETAPVAAQVHSDARAFLTHQVAEAQRRGEIRVDLDIDLAGYMLSRLSIGLEDYIQDRYQFSYAQVLSERRASLPVPREELERVTDSFIDLVRLGLETASLRTV